MPKTLQPFPVGSMEHRVYEALRLLRKGRGLMQNASDESLLLTLPVVKSEVRRHRLDAATILLALVTALARGLDPVKLRPAVTNAYEIDYVGPPGPLGCRRQYFERQFGVNETTIIKRENQGIVDITRRLLRLRDPIDELGPYIETARKPAPVLASGAPAGLDELHRADEGKVLYQENWYVLNSQRMPSFLLTFVTCESTLDGVLGTTYPYYDITGPEWPPISVERLEVVYGAEIGRHFPPVGSGAAATNINFPRPLGIGEQHSFMVAVHFAAVEADPLPRRGGHATVLSEQMLACRMRVQFLPNDPPQRARSYYSTVTRLENAQTEPEHLTIREGGYVEEIFYPGSEYAVCVIEWTWKEDYA